MINTVLRLAFLGDDLAAFIGDSEETKEVQGMFGPQNQVLRFPCLQLSKQMWEDYGRPVVLDIQVYDRSHEENGI